MADSIGLQPTKGTSRFLTARVLFVAVLALSCRPARLRGPIAHEAYVWQRAWTPAVRAAVARAAPALAGLTVLAAEVSWRHGQPGVVRVPIDLAALGECVCPIGLALRLGAFPGPFAGDDATARLVVDLAGEMVDQAHAAGLAPAELQLDFDCAQQDLAGYRLWVEAMRARVAPVPLSITVLPSWLGERELPALLRAAGAFVLQVHSLAAPPPGRGRWSLCEPEAARVAVERAGRIGVPFRVALPTYGYRAAFDARGKLAGLSAEGPWSGRWEGATIREVRANAGEMAGLVEGWRTSRPSRMRGVIWYRLPSDDDVLNWRWGTLAAIIAGRIPRPLLRAEARAGAAGVIEISLNNTGDADAKLPAAVRLRWGNARLLAGDGQGDFGLAPAPAGAELRPARSGVILPGERRVVGWLRLEESREVSADVEFSRQ
ncbi:MAG: DUF3142 domain-containing protein [Acidobacteriota bacterium]